MDVANITSQQLDALQRVGYVPRFPPSLPLALLPRSACVMFQIDEVSGGGRSSDRGGTASRPNTSLIGGQSNQTQNQSNQPLSSVLVGAYGAQAGIAFALSSTNNVLSVRIGQVPISAKSSVPPASTSLILRLLRTKFAPLRAVRTEAPDFGHFSRAGMVLGLPTMIEGASGPTDAPIDRLVRAMVGQSWACHVLAIPMGKEEITQLRTRCLDEIRRVEAATTAGGISNPLAQRYLELLNYFLQDMMFGLSVGMWRVATYLVGTESSYPELAALWQGLYSEGGGGREPIQVTENSVILDWARNFGIANGETAYPLHPFPYQTLFSSTQLAQVIDLPTQESAGFGIRRHARFDVTQTQMHVQKEASALVIGAISNYGVDQADYSLSLSALQRHAFVAGVTGAGKSNTVFHLLKQLHVRKIPFLVLEPAKNEYRALLADPDVGPALRVYTVGDERTLPLRLNPFEVVGWPVNPVSVHIDLLRSCFAASFGMWTPLPQILEQCLHEIYRDRGWDVVSNTNARLDEGAIPSVAFPTMADLAGKVDFYTSTLGYDDRVRADLRAALLTRVRGLRIGGKGAMFECRESLSMEQLMGQPTILELQNLGDDDDKAFLMALLFIRIVEYRRATATQSGLRHLLVIEEAHRLLTNVGRSGQAEQADPRGQAVETFSNLISEIRAYGQGLAVVDQVPTKLAPDVIKNTNLKIVHRIVAEDDRSVLAGAMAMDEPQKAALASLGVGKVAIFEDGEDAPILVTVPPAKDQLGMSPTDADVRSRMKPVAGDSGEIHSDHLYLVCVGQCKATQSACRRAAEAAEDPMVRRTFAKLVVSALGDAGAVSRLWPDLVSVATMRKQIDPTQDSVWTCLLVHCSDALARRWGARFTWSYRDTARFGNALARAVVSGVGKGQVDDLLSFVEDGRSLLAGQEQRCSACNVCQDRFGDNDMCYGKAAVLDLIDEGAFAEEFASADREDERAGDEHRMRTLSVANSAAYELIEFPIEDSPDTNGIGRRARRCVLCFSHHVFARTVLRAPWIISTRLNKLAGNFDPAIETELEVGNKKGDL